MRREEDELKEIAYTEARHRSATVGDVEDGLVVVSALPGAALRARLDEVKVGGDGAAK